MYQKNRTQITLLTQDAAQYLDFQTILDTDNLAEILSGEMRASVADKVSTRYNTDLQSRSEKQKQLQEIIKYVLSQSERRSFPFEGASNVIFPLISTACVEFAAKCYPEIFKDGNIVKAKVIGSDDGEVMKDAEGNEMRNEDGSIVSYKERTLAQQVVAKHGFIPCESHAQEILEGKKTIEELILPTRECPRTFVRPKQLPAKYPRCTDTPRCSPIERTPLVVEKHCLSE